MKKGDFDPAAAGEKPRSMPVLHRQRRRDFEKQLEQRLTENRLLAEKPFLPKTLVPAAVFVGTHLFYLLLGLAFLLTVSSFLISETFGLAISKRILLLR